MEAKESGSPVSKQAHPVGLHERCEIITALLSQGSAESHKRAAVIQLNGVAVGRPCEVASFSVDVLEWAYGHKEGNGVAVARWPQPKVHKDKVVVLCAGAEMNLCPIYALGAAFAAGCFANQTWHADCMNSLFPEFSMKTVAA